MPTSLSTVVTMTSPSKTVSLLQAIHEKFRDDLEQEFEHIDIATRKKTSTCTVPGLLPIPPCLALNNIGISCHGDEAELSQLCCTVKELDVAQNKITSWEEVFAMLKCMESLHFINLSSNLLDPTVSCVNNHVFSNITELVLNNTQLPWSTVESLLLNTFPCLEELHLSLNNYSTLSLNNENTHKYPSLKTLHLDGNQLTEFKDICQIGSMFPNLQTLFMSGNQIETFPSEDYIKASLCRLQCLALSKNLIKEWSELEKLNSFPKLIDVKLQYNPVIASYNNIIRRQFTIAGLPARILRLNGSTIGEEEREIAEKTFITHFMGEDIKPSKFFELEAKHGILDHCPTVKVILKQSVWSDEHTSKQMTLQINKNQSLGELKKVLSRFCGLKPHRMRVYHQSTGHRCGDDPNFTNHRLVVSNIVDGDEIIIVPRVQF